MFFSTKWFLTFWSFDFWRSDHPKKTFDVLTLRRSDFWHSDPLPILCFPIILKSVIVLLSSLIKNYFNSFYLILVSIFATSNLGFDWFFHKDHIFFNFFNLNCFTVNTYLNYKNYKASIVKYNFIDFLKVGLKKVSIMCIL